MDPIKDAFEKVRNDMDSLKIELNSISDTVSTTRNQMTELCEIIQNLFEKVDKIALKQEKLTLKQENLALKQENMASTHNSQIQTPSTHTSTVPQEIGGLKGQNLGISTGNEGVSTDRQTHRQTDNSTQFIEENGLFGNNQAHFNPQSSISPQKQSSEGIPPQSSQLLPQPLQLPYSAPISPQIPFNQPIQPKTPHPATVNDASDILASLDSIKKEVRLKVKRLTEQEWLIFSTIYQLQEQQIPVDYKTLASRLHLTESSIRDYVGRIIKKGIPVDKSKINNKSIQLLISPNLQKIASLSTIMQLRGL